MLACCLLPLLLFTTISYFVFPDVIWVVGFSLIIVVAPFFVWKPVATLLKNAKIKSALRKGIKKVTTGPLQNLEAGMNFPLRSFLLYTINNSTVKVWAPFGSKIERNGYLKQAQVRLEVLPLSAKNNSILAIYYVDIPQASILTEPVSTIDKKLKRSDQKTLVTGIITEVILSHDDESNTKRYWYRVGNELFDGGTAYSSFMLKDKVCFSYLAKRNGEPEDIIDAAKID